MPTMAPKQIPSVEAINKDSPMPTLPKIHEEPKLEDLININKNI